ncbi:MAG: bile acid:sodium symporter [Chloroflexota bacterium]|nr:bile acid:sodium symporter [Chloroflexota bacterium]
MFNVGLTQKPARILGNLRDWHFLIRMLVANFLIVPSLMIALVYVTDFDPALQAGLLTMSACAGAPFLIKLTQTSANDIALGATVMMVLVVGTVAFAPLILPLIIEGVQVDSWAIATSLLRQLLLPIIVGMVLAQVFPRVRDVIQPLIARIGNYALYGVLVSSLVGYWPNLRGMIGTGAIAGGVAVLALAFWIGYLMGDGKDHLQDVGGLGTGQRNTAAAMIIAANNFTDPNTFVLVTVVNALGIIMLMIFARALSKDKAGSMLVNPTALRAERAES